MLVTKRVGLASLENNCDTLSTTDTSSSDGVSFVESVKVVHQVGSDSCSTRSERMSESCRRRVGVSREQKEEKERKRDVPMAPPKTFVLSFGRSSSRWTDNH